MEKIVRRWSGPISLVVYLKDSEVPELDNLIKSSSVMSETNDLNIHLVFREGVSKAQPLRNDCQILNLSAFGLIAVKLHKSTILKNKPVLRNKQHCSNLKQLVMPLRDVEKANFTNLVNDLESGGG